MSQAHKSIEGPRVKLTENNYLCTNNIFPFSMNITSSQNTAYLHIFLNGLNHYTSYITQHLTLKLDNTCNREAFAT